MCAGRESNPGLVRGRDVYYHCTTGAESQVHRGLANRGSASAQLSNLFDRILVTRPTGPSPLSRLAQLVERKTLNLVVEGSSPSVGSFLFCFKNVFCVCVYVVRGGEQLLWRSWQRVGLIILRSRVRPSQGAAVPFLLLGREPTRRVARTGCIGWVAERSKALV